MVRLVLIIASLCLTASTIFEVKVETRRNIMVYPVGFASSDTGFGGGLAGLIDFYTVEIDPDSTETRISENRWLFNAFYTVKNQLNFSLKADIKPEGEWEYELDSKILRWPSTFFPVGTHSNFSDREEYTLNLARATVFAGHRFGGGFIAGPLGRFLLYDVEDPEDGGTLDNRGIDGSEGMFVSGLGLQAIYDTRDNDLSPWTGSYIEMRSVFYSPGIGSQATYETFRFDMRRYVQFAPFLLLANQAYFEAVSGDVPFLELPEVGSSPVLRGYPDDRFRDKACFALQSELRFPIWWRLHGAVFSGLGNVGPSPGQLSLHNLKVTSGFSVRFLFFEKERFYLRADWAITNSTADIGADEHDKTGFYINAMETF